MNKKRKLKICNLALLIAALPVIITSIALYTGIGLRYNLCGITRPGAVAAHCFFAVIMLALVAYHLFLHFGNTNWWLKAAKLKSHVTTMLFRIAVINLICALAAFISYWFILGHNTICDVHAFIGFIFILIAIGHTLKRRKWFTR